MMKKLTLALMISAALGGCASFPEHYDKPINTDDITQQMTDEWSNMPAVTFVKSNAGMVVKKHNTVPEEIRKKRVNIAFNGGMQATLAELFSVLNTQGYRVSGLRLSDDTKKKLWPVRQFDAPLGDLLDDLSANYNIAFEYRNNMIYMVEGNRYSASLPQHKDFLAKVSAALKDLGATEIRSDVLAGQVYYTAKPDVADYIEEYLNTISKNSAMVTLQVAVLTVGVNRDVNLGFDWAKFAVMRGSGGMKADIGSILKSGSGTTTTTTTTTTNGTTGTGGTTTTVGNAVADTAAAVVTGSLLSFAGAEGFGFKFANDAFSLTAALKALSTYGNARTEQNVVLGTLSGMPVKINSGNDIPYVKSIGAATAAGGATQGSSQTETIKSGLKIEVTPNFDASDGTVITQVKVDMSTLIGFRELSAGQNLGTLSQPEMQNLGFENVGRLSAGETIIVGGITYDQLSNNYTNFPGMEKLNTGSKAEKVNRSAIYIVVRPTVVIFTPQANELNAKLRSAEVEAAKMNKAAREAARNQAQAPVAKEAQQ